jgi:hypothetical protein
MELGAGSVSVIELQQLETLKELLYGLSINQIVAIGSDGSLMLWDYFQFVHAILCY